MKVVYSKHAKERVDERQLSKSAIEKTISTPDFEVSSFRNRSVLRKKYKNKMLEVVIKKENGKIHVITAYYLKE